MCTRVFVYVCKYVCQSEDRGKGVVDKVFVSVCFFSEKSHSLDGGASKMSLPTPPDPFVIDSSCLLLVSHLPQVPQELPSPQGFTLAVDSVGFVP